MPFRLYQGDTVVDERDSPLEIDGLDFSTSVENGEYQVARFDGDNESERVDIPSFTTSPEPEPDPPEEETGEQSLDNFTISQLQEQLDEEEVDYPKGKKKQYYIDLLED